MSDRTPTQREKALYALLSDVNNNKLLKEAESASIEALFEWAFQRDIDEQTFRESHPELYSRIENYAKEYGVDSCHLLEDTECEFYSNALTAALSAIDSEWQK